MDDIEKLIRQLKGPDPEVRADAAYRLADSKDPRAVPGLIKAVREDRFLCSPAARALGEVKDKKAVPAFIDALDDEDDRVRKAAADRLGYFKDPRAVPGLIRALRDEDRFVRGSAAWALGRIGDAKAVGPLIEALERDPEGGFSFLRGLVDIGEPSVIPLIEMLENADGPKWTNEDPRNWAAQGLGQIGDARAIPALHDALKNDNRFMFRETVAKALERIADVRAVPALIEHKEPSSEAVYRFARAVEKEGMGLVRLRALLQDFVENAGVDEREGKKQRAASTYAKIAKAVAERKKKEMGGVLSEGTVPKPRGDKKMYRVRRAIDG